MQETSPKLKIKEELVLQGLLLSDKELLIYKDENAEYHVITTQPFDKSKTYTTIFMTFEDLPPQSPQSVVV